VSGSQEGVFKVDRNEKGVTITSKQNDMASFHQRLVDVLSDDVQELYIQTDNDAIDLSFISKCSHLEKFSLNMDSKSVRKIDLSPLARARINKDIDLSFMGADVSFLESIDLSFLGESDVPVSFAVDAYNANFQVVRDPGERIRLHFGGTTRAFFNKVLSEALSEEIAGLDIKFPDNDIDLSMLTRFTHQTDLKLDMFHNVGELDLRVLGKMPIKKLYLRYSESIPSPDLSFLREMKHLEGLTVMGIMRVSGGLDFSPISDCCSLKQFTLDEDHMTDIDLSPLSSCTRLEELVIKGNNPVSFRLTMPDLSRHTNMRTIEVHLYKFKDTTDKLAIDLSGVAGCRSLQILDLGFNNTIRELDLSPLATCTGLQQLDLSECRNLEELDLTPLGSLPSLEYLYLSRSCPYDKIDLTPLGTCESLKRLYIENDTNKSQDWNKNTYEVHELDVTSLFRLRDLEYVLLFKDVRGDVGIDPAWPSGESRPVDHLDYYYKYLRPRRTTRQWLEQGVKSPFTKVTSLPTTLLVEESEPEVQVYIGYPGMDFYGVSSQRPPEYHDDENWRKRIEFLVNASPLTPRLLADSSKVPESERKPAWAKAYDIEWY
jgi:Leucine-rich repeat (LRR) protein